MNKHTTLPAPAAYVALVTIVLIGLALLAFAIFATLTAKDSGLLAHTLGAVIGWIMTVAWFVALAEVLASARFDRD